MKRRLLNLLTLLSLLLCVAVVVLWVHSYFAYDSLSGTRTDRLYSLDSHAGTLSVVHCWFNSPFGDGRWASHVQDGPAFWQYDDLPITWGGLGFGRRRLVGYLEAGDTNPRWVMNVITLPHWLVVGALGAALL